MGSQAGAIATAAGRIGVDVAEYLARRAAGEKWCTPCKAWRHCSAFGADRSRRDGLSSRCRAHGRRAAAGPTKPQRQLAAAFGRAWCRSCEDWKASTDVHGGLCREHRNADYRDWYATSPNAVKGRAAARRRGVAVVGPETRARLVEATDGLCAYSCGGKATTLDHVIPVANGGESKPGNVVPACGSCNSRKRDRDPLPWVDLMTPEALDLVMPGVEHDGALLDLLDAA